MTEPRGWAFRDLPADLWSEFDANVRSDLRSRDVPLSSVTPYFYELHDLEHIARLLAEAASDADCVVAKALFRHLVVNWAQLQRFLRAEIAAVPDDRAPSMRTKPRRARDDERIGAGDNLWLWRLRQRQFCPTTHGPRAPSDTWIRTTELERRFTSKRGGVDAGQLLPVLDVPDTWHSLRAVSEHHWAFATRSRRRACARRMPKRSPSAAGGHLRRGHPGSAVREVVRPTYRALIELLPGRTRTRLPAQRCSPTHPCSRTTALGLSFQARGERALGGAQAVPENGSVIRRTCGRSSSNQALALACR